MPTIVCTDCDHEFGVNIFNTRPRCERCGAGEFRAPDDRSETGESHLEV